ncbi:MAG: NHL repeat-containing protein [Pirellulales bacterium]|nr:NHL repeat-containing protein [Pirellulales bacterium]
MSSCIGATLFAAVVVGTYALYRLDPWANRGNDSPTRSALDLQDQFSIQPQLIHYLQTSEIPIPLDVVRAIAVGLEDRIYVAGDRTVYRFGSDGAGEVVLHTDGEPTCLAIGFNRHVAPGTFYVGVGKAIEVFLPNGEPLAVWHGLSDKTVLTSIAVSENDIYAADAGERVVIRFNPQGEIAGQIGRTDPDREMPGFILPSAYFDVAIGPDGELYAVNPGARRIEEYTSDGMLEGFWGKAGTAVDAFFGCCNPAHMAILPDGRFVTSEKGIPRIKVYNGFGEFECVVAGPSELGVRDSATVDARLEKNTQVFDIAIDSQGRILVLDPNTKRIRIFESRQEK